MTAEQRGEIEKAFLRLVRLPTLKSTDSLPLHRLVKEVTGEEWADMVLVLVDTLRAGGAVIGGPEINAAKRELLKILDRIPTAVARHIVVTLHGIKTRGTWQKHFTPDLGSVGFTPYPLDYDNFWAMQLVRAGQRRAKVDWFRDQYENIRRQDAEADISIVSHSFGTYMTAESMLTYPEIIFNRIIYCGAIVRRDFPWGEIFSRGQAKRALNDFGGLDFWAKTVVRAVKDSGRSGIEGFSESHPLLLQRYYPRHRHSDYLHPSHYRTGWIPFLKGDTPIMPPRPQDPPANPYYLWRRSRDR